MTCPTCKGTVRSEMVRSSPDGVNWVTKTFLRCISLRMTKKCPVLVVVDGNDPIPVTPGRITNPPRRKTLTELKNLEGPEYNA